MSGPRKAQDPRAPQPKYTQTAIREHSKGKGQEAAQRIYQGGTNNTQTGTAILRTAPDTALATTACIAQLTYYYGSHSMALERLMAALEKHS